MIHRNLGRAWGTPEHQFHPLLSVCLGIDPSFSYSFIGGSLYILEVTIIYVTNIFSKSISCLLNLWHTEILNYDMVQWFLYVFSFFGSL